MASKKNQSLVAVEHALQEQMKEEPEMTDEEQILLKPNPLIVDAQRAERLSDTQERFLIAKLQGVTDAAAARAIGVSPETVYGWKKRDDNFLSLYDAVVSNPLEFAAGSLVFSVNKALLRLVEMLDHKSTKVQQYAIDRLIDLGGLRAPSRVEVKHVGRDDVDAARTAGGSRIVDAGPDGRGSQ